jgi:hypothetical protein
MSEREIDPTAAAGTLRVVQHAPMQREHERGPEHERAYEHVIDALCGAAGRIVNVSFAADGQPILNEYP